MKKKKYEAPKQKVNTLEVGNKFLKNDAVIKQNYRVFTGT